MTKQIKSIPVGVFHQSGEELNKKKQSKSVSRTDNVQMRKLILDLKTHQIELELQNQELLKAKNQLAAQAEKYAELYDFAPTAYFTLAKSGEILELNLLGSQMFGKERSKLKDKKFGLYVSEDSIPIFNRFLDSVFTDNSKQTCEIVLVADVDSPMYVSLSGTVAVNNEQCLISVVDLTHLKKAEDSLIQMATDWQTTFDASSDLIWLLDKDQRVVRTNKASEKFCHRPSGELVGMHCWELIHGMSEPIPECPFRRATGSLKRETMELQIGSDWFDVAVDPVLDSKGQYAGAVHIVSNITARKQAETSLIDDLDRLHKISSRVPGMVFQYLLRPDGSSCFPFASDAMRDIYRVSPDEVREDASKVFLNLHPDDYEDVVATIAKSARELSPWQHEYRVKFSDGTIRLLYGNSVPQLQEDGSVLWHGFITDITQRKQLEESVLESERRLRRVNESGMFGMFYWNNNGQITEANDKFLEMVGYTREELEDNKIDWMKLTPHEFKYKDDNALSELNLNGILNAPYEKEYVRHDGTPLPILLTAALLDEKRLRGVAIVIDITDRKEAEKAINKSELLYRTLFEKANEGILYLSTDLKIKMVNDAFARMHGYSVDELLNMSITDLETPAPLQLSAEKLASLQSGETIKFEVEHSHRDGHVFPMEVSSNLISLEGELIIQAFNLDITERKIAEKTLRESEERYRTIVKASPDNITITDIDGHILMVSPVGLTMFMYEHEQELLGRPIEEFIVFQDLERAANRISQMKQGIFHGSEEYQGIRSDGTTFDIEVNGQIIKGIDDQPSMIVFIVRDITARKKAADALYESEVQYRSLFNNFLDGVAVHQIVLDNSGNPVDYIFLQANDAFEKQTGLNISKILGKCVTEVIPGIEKTPFIEIYGKVALTGESITFEQFVEPLNRFYHINAFSTGEGRFCTVIQDITHLKLADQALHESESKFRNLVWDLQVGVLLQDSQAKILLCNPKALELLGLSEDQLLGKTSLDPFWNVIHEDGSPFPGSTHPVVEAIASRSPVHDVVMGVRHSSESKLVWLLVDAEPQLNADGTVRQVVCSFIDISLRKQDEEALIQSHNLLESLARLVPGVIYQYRLYPDGRSSFPYASPGMNDIYEITPEEVQQDASKVFDRLHPEDFAQVVDAIQESARTLNMFYCEYRVILPQQGLRWRWSQAQPLRMEDGSILWHGIISDITERKLAEEALHESEQKFRDTVINLDEGYYSVTLEGTLLDHNQAFNRILEFDQTADLKGAYIPDFWQNPDLRGEYVSAIIANGSVTNYQIDFNAQTGVKKVVLVNAHLVKDKDNRPIRIEGVILDITERIHLEEALQRHADRLQNLHKIDKAILSPVESHEAIIQKALQHIRSLLSSQHASIGIFDFENEALQLFAANIKDGTIAQTEKYMINNVYPELDTLRQNRMHVIEDISMKSSPPELLRVLQSEGIMSCINVPLVSGEKLIGAMNLGWKDTRAFTTEELEIASEVADEITIAIEQVRLRQEARKYTEEIEKRVEERTSQLLNANRELEAFSYSVSHDLRAPLRHINGYVSLLTKHLEDKLSEKEKHYLDTIADSTRQMGVLIDDLLHFSRTGRQEMQLTNLDMNVVLQDALREIKHENHDRVIRWEIAALPRICGDYSLLRLVWLNLLRNAAKFTRAKVDTRIEIGVVDQAPEFVFFVRDNGVGFDMQYADKLFGVFERLHSTQEFEGTGIGLANVRRIIRRHEGRTWAEAEKDKGATFYFTLPKLEAESHKSEDWEQKEDLDRL